MARGPAEATVLCLRSAGHPARVVQGFPLRAGIYDKASAERHWERLFDLFGRTLRGEKR